ncbi:MAG: hypothetical protein HQL33_04705 [Alphaproteobacteria bacterium]|nr:hypothetical protein [Alphaproteobacteria bacterium]
MTPSVIIVDTSIFLNVLDVPAFNQNRSAVYGEFKNLLADQNISLLLPMAAVIETGNHIAQVADGGLRRLSARRFTEQVKAAMCGDAPWRTTQVPGSEAIEEWLDEFPDHAMRGIGMGDLSIIKEWEACCRRHPRHRVRIWSLDNAMAGYDRAP